VWAAGDVNQPACSNEGMSGFQAYLPDCRAYELVTPPYKEGADVSIEAISADGSRLVGESIGAFAGGESDEVPGGGGLGPIYQFTRTSAGWRTTALSPPAKQYPVNRLLDLSSDLSRSLFRLRTPSQPEGEGDLYVRQPDGSFARMGPLQPPNEAPRFGSEYYYLGASKNLDAVFISKEPRMGLWPGDTTVGLSLYEYAGLEVSEPKLVGVSNAGPLTSNREAHLISSCNTSLGSYLNEVHNAVSASGAIVFFTAGACEGSPPVGELYARVDGSHTVAISEPALSVPGRVCTGTCENDEQEPSRRKEGVFQGASEDGSKVFFLTEQPLLDSDENGEGEGMDLYEAELEGGAVKKLVQVSHAPNAGEAAGVDGVVRVSDDGSRVYFVARSVLTSAANAQGEQAEAGAENLYMFATASEQMSFVTRLSPQDGELFKKEDERPVQTTSDGRFLVFSSFAHPTGTSDTSAVSQIFEYDAQASSLTRVSIGQDGFNNDGNTEVEENAPDLLSHNYENLESPKSTETFSSVSNDGSRVWFMSRNSLTPQAMSGIVNVYEYHDGNVYLISDGHDESARQEGFSGHLLGASASGEDVFFETPDRLSPEDTDTQHDLYDARLGGGLQEPVSPPGCSDDACQGALSATPALALAGSVTQVAGGNLRPVATSRSAGKPRAKKPSKKKRRRHRVKQRAKRKGRS
jgi:hypothetical protein